jgi:hypothetical protein
MGQHANSGRNASLDNKKARAAGRQNEKGRHSPRERAGEELSKGATGGAFGKHGHPNNAVAAQETRITRTARRRSKKQLD